MTEEARPTGTTEDPATGTTATATSAAGGSADPAAGGSGATEPSVEEKLAAAQALLEDQKRINAQLLAEKSNRARTDGGPNGAATTGPPHDAAATVADQQARREAEEILEQARLESPATVTLLETFAQNQTAQRQRDQAERIFDRLPAEYRDAARTRWESGDYRTATAAGNAAKDAHDAKTLREALDKREKDELQAKPVTRTDGYVGASHRSVTATEHSSRSKVTMDQYQTKMAEFNNAGKSREGLAWGSSVDIVD